jgi:hypothetical protein
MSQLALCWAFGSSLILAESPPPLGEEFQVNSYTPLHQSYPHVAASATGEFVVVWESNGGLFPRLSGQRYTTDGYPLGEEFIVTGDLVHAPTDPEVAVDPVGGFVVVWKRFATGLDIFAQRYDNEGAQLGVEFRVNSQVGDHQYEPAIATDASGSFVVVWESRSGEGDGFGIFAQRYDATGNPLGGEFLVNTVTAGDQRHASVAAAPVGEFVVVWDSQASVFGQRYDSEGKRVGGQFLVNAPRPEEGASEPSTAMDASGDFVVAWLGPDGDYTGVFARLFDAAGEPKGSQFQVNTYTTNWSITPSVARDASGPFVVTWGSYHQDGSYWGVFGQRYDADGNPWGTEFQVNTYTTYGQFQPAAAADAAGRFVVVWTSGGQDGDGAGVFGQRYSGNGFFTDGFESGDTSAWDQTVP